MTRKKILRRWDVTGKHQLEQVEFKLPRIKADDAHLEFIANGVCGSDTHMFCTGAVHSGHKGPHRPLPLGHELIGAAAPKCCVGKPGLFAGLPNSLGCLCPAGEQFSEVSDPGSMRQLVDLGEI